MICLFFLVDASKAGEGQLEISINDGDVPNAVQVQTIIIMIMIIIIMIIFIMIILIIDYYNRENMKIIFIKKKKMQFQKVAELIIIFIIIKI